MRFVADRREFECEAPINPRERERQIERKGSFDTLRERKRKREIYRQWSGFNYFIYFFVGVI